MGTANFKSMDDFPLIVADDSYCKVCPECGVTNGKDAGKCDVCGCDLANVEAVYDELGMQDICRDMETVAKWLTDAQPFYDVTVQSGYYAGLQFYVDCKYYDIESMDNEDAQCEFGLCRSVMLRKFESAGNMIRRELKKAKAELGLMELGVTARFSNGETLYTEIKPDMPKRAALKVALAKVA